MSEAPAAFLSDLVRRDPRLRPGIFAGWKTFLEVAEAASAEAVEVPTPNMAGASVPGSLSSRLWLFDSVLAGTLRFRFAVRFGGAAVFM
jgi:hypothetical protein